MGGESATKTSLSTIGDAGSAADAGAPISDVKGSCDCSVGPGAKPRPPLTLLWLALALIWRHRRRGA
jgi:MYXO-CTERM domain-containing protein